MHAGSSVGNQGEHDSGRPDGSTTGDGDTDLGDNDAATSANTATREGFAQALLRAVCENMMDCRLAYGDASSLRSALGSVERCMSYYAPRVGDAKPRLFGVDVSVYRYQRAQADACVARFTHQCFLSEVEEPEDHALRSTCSEVFEGESAVGGACTRSLDCAGDAYCAVTDFQCPGVCTARKEPGANCESTGECALQGAEGVRCDYAPGGPTHQTCVIATRVTTVGEGESCHILRNGSSELTLALCGDGLTCDENMDEYRCRRANALGASCSDDFPECAAGSVCSTDEGASGENPPSHCVAFTTLEVGQPCPQEAGTGGASPAFCLGLERPTYCDETGHCAPEPMVAEGGSCERFDCGPGLTCVYGSGASICKRTAAIGESCKDAPCAHNADCRGINGVSMCQPRCSE